VFSEKIKGREGEEEALKCFFVEVEGVEVEVVDPQLFPARLVSHSTHFQALPPRGIDSEHREEQLVGIRYGKAGLEFSRHPEHPVAPDPLSPLALQSSGTLKNAKARQNYSIFAETTPQRKATIQRTHSNKKESQSEEEKAAKERLKRPKKRVLGADFTAFGPFPFLSLALTLQRGPQTIITIAPRRLKHRMRE
jgi:hypothetical protein